MCLNLIDDELSAIIATEDIVVYKAVLRMIMYSINYDNITDLQELHGLPFKAVISGKNYQGVVSIENNEVFLCNNSIEGLRCVEKFGFRYSYVFSQSVTSIVVNDIELVKGTQSFITPFRHCEILIGETYRSKIEKVGDNIERALHSFKFLESAEDLTWITHKTFVKCIIPKGSTYYKGTFQGSFSYASDSLIYVEIISDEDEPSE